MPNRLVGGRRGRGMPEQFCWAAVSVLANLASVYMPVCYRKSCLNPACELSWYIVSSKPWYSRDRVFSSWPALAVCHRSVVHTGAYTY